MMKKVKFKNDELLMERAISYISFKTKDKDILFKNATKILVERSIKGNMILLKSNCISKDMKELFYNKTSKINVSLENLCMISRHNESEDIIEDFGTMKPVYFYIPKPCTSNNYYEYTIVLCSINSDFDYNDIMRLVEREERQQLNSTIYKVKNSKIKVDENQFEDMKQSYESVSELINEWRKTFNESIKSISNIGNKSLDIRDNGFTLTENDNIVDINYDDKTVKISKDDGDTWEYGTAR